MFDRLLMVLEILLLIVIVWQGELIRRYEKWTYEMNRERYDERKKWRQEKQKQAIKKLEPPKSPATLRENKSDAGSLSPCLPNESKKEQDGIISVNVERVD